MASFLIVKGVCRPETFESLEVFKGIQRETNRVLDAKNQELLFVDGRIGSNTISAVNSVLGSTFKNCAEIAQRASSVFEQLKRLADGRQLAVVADPDSIIRTVVSPPSKFDRETGKVVHPSLATAGFAGIPLWAIALVGVGGYYYYSSFKGKGKKRKSLTGAF